jgi:hypothetical protein
MTGREAQMREFAAAGWIDGAPARAILRPIGPRA